MKKSIFYKMLYVCVVALIIAGSVSAFILQSNYEQNQINQFKRLIETAAKSTSSTDASYISSITGKERITIIDYNGNVISDSSVSEPLDNHNLRPEVASAKESGSGISKRKSETLGSDMLYVAISHNNFIYRISVPLGGLDASFIKQLPAIITGVLVAGLVAVFLANNIVNSAIKPLTDINSKLSHIYEKDYDNVNLPLCDYDEINPIIKAINEVVCDISMHIKDLSLQNDKMDFILNNMAQGLVVIDEQANIVHCNDFASVLFEKSGDIIGKSLVYLTRENKIVDSASKAISTGNKIIFDITNQDNIYAVYVKPIHASWQNNGAIIMITDVTEERSRQQLRQQFVGNVSHDLKTPITAIGGFAELLTSGLIKNEEKKQEYLARILDQSHYMENVVNDLLALCELDETKEIINPQTINAYDVCSQIISSFRPMAKDLNLTLSVSGNADTTVKMNHDHFKKIIDELMSNAIKYNAKNGSVNIDLSYKGEKTKIAVSNTGCEINPLHIPRLFERFYREDKSRNSKVPGTGLGLSIIKHIVSLYGGNISVSSNSESGTVFTIVV